MRKIPLNGTALAIAVLSAYAAMAQFFLRKLATNAQAIDPTAHSSEFSPMAIYLAAVLARSAGLFLILFLYVLNPLMKKPAREWLFAVLAIVYGWSVFWFFPSLS